PQLRRRTPRRADRRGLCRECRRRPARGPPLPAALLPPDARRTLARARPAALRLGALAPRARAEAGAQRVGRPGRPLPRAQVAPGLRGAPRADRGGDDVVSAARFDELYERYNDGVLSDVERQEFLTLLEDPGNRARFAQAASFEAVISEELRLAEPP